ncbi:MAG TPA: hypothetical protein VKV77_11330, partial [Methylovirgula sp.]|nr:hypothetical protein [Methylovirgula sp.]
MVPGSYEVSMLVYGDRSRQTEVRGELESLASLNETLALMPAGIERHAWLADLFIRAAELAQGIADAEFEQWGEDRLTFAQQVSMRLVRATASSLCQSWQNGFAAAPLNIDAQLRLLSSAEGAIHCRRQEGFAFYALYPEAYFAAARRCGLQFHSVLGIRSIGLGLAAIVAEATAARTCISVRPIGHPFRRKLALGADFKSTLGAEPVAVVDEGPGLSGSSFLAAAETLEQLGLERIHLFPSHRNPPGFAASEATRKRWNCFAKHVEDFDALFIESQEPRHQLADWCADVTGPALAPLEDLGGGQWRRYRPGAPALPRWERRKFLLRSTRGSFLLRFVGLGRYGSDSLRRARQLAGAGFTPPVLGLRHGFLIEEWLDARPIETAPRSALLARLASYLAFRARHMPAPPASGASLSELAAMLVHNAGEIGLAPNAWKARARALEARVRPIETDNKLQLWEWLHTPCGIVKADAYDHCAGHDLVGCQDIAWDIAG